MRAQWQNRPGPAGRHRGERMKGWFKRYRALWIVGGLAAAVFLLVQASGLGLCAVQSGSMEPAIPTYSLCLVTRRVDFSDLEIGDVVVYTRAADGLRIVHRVVAFADGGAVTKGDANQVDDGVSVTADNLYAKYIAHIPYLGRIFTPRGKLILGALAVVILIFAVWDDVRQVKGKKRA